MPANRTAWIAAVIWCALVLVLLAWLAGESHYRSCVAAAPVAYDVDHGVTESSGAFLSASDARGVATYVKRATATPQIDDCSRLP